MYLRDSAPYPWPYDGKVEPRRIALLIAGPQPAWADVSQRSAEVMEVIEVVAGALRDAGGHVVAVRHVASGGGRPRSLPPPADHPASALLDDLPKPDLVVEALGVDGFHASPLDISLRKLGVDRLVMAGFGAEAAVDSTLRSANDRGYECLTLVDGTAPFDDATHRCALSSITMSGGIFGAIATSRDLLLTLSSTGAP